MAQIDEFCQADRAGTCSVIPAILFSTQPKSDLTATPLCSIIAGTNSKTPFPGVKTTRKRQSRSDHPNGPTDLGSL
jgi:hypothetical protein